MARLTSPEFRHWLEYFSLKFLGKLIVLLPVSLSINLAAMAGAFIYYFIPIRRRIVWENLDIAFGSTMSKREKRRVARECYKTLAMLTVETFYVQYAPLDWPERHVTEVENDEAWRKLREQGIPVVCVCAHFGSWEVLIGYGKKFFPASLLAKRLHNPLVQEEVRKTRERHGHEIIWAGEEDTIRRVIRTIRENERVLNVMIDQDARMEGIFIPFFGRPASTLALPALMAVRQEAALVPVFIVRTGMTRHRVVFKDPVFPPTDDSMSKGEKAEALMKHVTRELEDMVRLYPAQYFWFHRRWRTTPEQVERRREKLKRKRLEKLRENKEALP